MKGAWSIKTAAVATMLALVAWPAAIGMTGTAAAAPAGTKVADLYAGPDHGRRGRVRLERHDDHLR